MTQVINSLWIGGDLGFIEQTSMCSFLDAGHEFHLYSFGEVQNVPEGVVVRDAGDIIEDSIDLSPFYEKKAWSALSNFFRYKIMSKKVGIWVDMDIICVTKLDFTDSEIFGRSGDKFINGAVLYIENENLIRDLLNIFSVSNGLPPWLRKYSKHKRYAKLYAKNLFFGPLHIVDLPWGTSGPKGLTWMIEKHNLTTKAKEESTFYPLKMVDADKAFDPEFDIQDILEDNTKTIHLWNNKIKHHRNKAPHSESYMGKLCKKYALH